MNGRWAGARRQPSVELFDGGDFAKVLTCYWYGYSPDFYFLSESNHNVVKSIERLISQGLSECERSVKN